jgi:uncharacterized protein (DUF2164 family)
MNGKWDHSTKPSTYKLLDNDGKVSYSGSFKDCMEKQNKMNEEITQDVYFTRGYEKGYSDAQEILSRKMSKVIMDDSDAGYDQGVKDCHRILKEQLDEMIDNCRVQDEYSFKLVRDELFSKNDG